MAETLRILGVGDAKSRHFGRWATRLAERGHEVHVASGRVNPREGELDGLVVHQFQDLDRLLKVPPVRRFRMAPALAGLARQVQPDVVHSHYLLPYGYWAARASLGPLVVSPWGKDAIVDAWQSPEGEERARVAIAPERALAYVVNSQALEDAAVRLGADRAKFHRIFWHARIDSYSPEHADRSRWSALGWPDDAVVCLSLRNFRPYSNLDVVLRSFAKAREEVPELRLFSSAGGGWTREEFDRLAAELGVEPYMAVRDVPAAELPSVTASADFAVESQPRPLPKPCSGPGCSQQPLVPTPLPMPPVTERADDCGNLLALELDHDDPVANGGPTTRSNMKWRCNHCHREKTERDRRAGLLSGAAARAPNSRSP